MADLESRGTGSFQADLDAYHACNAVSAWQSKPQSKAIRNQRAES